MRTLLQPFKCLNYWRFILFFIAMPLILAIPAGFINTEFILNLYTFIVIVIILLFAILLFTIIVWPIFSNMYALKHVIESSMKIVKYYPNPISLFCLIRIINRDKLIKLLVEERLGNDKFKIKEELLTDTSV